MIRLRLVHMPRHSVALRASDQMSKQTAEDGLNQYEKEGFTVISVLPWNDEWLLVVLRFGQ